MEVKINKDENKYKYDIDVLINFFFPKRDSEISENKNLPTLCVEIDDNTVEVSLIRADKEIEENNIICSFKEENVENDDRKIKSVIKQLTYKNLSYYTKRELPWGGNYWDKTNKACSGKVRR